MSNKDQTDQTDQTAITAVILVLSLGLCVSASVYVSALTKLATAKQRVKINCSDVANNIPSYSENSSNIPKSTDGTVEGDCYNRPNLTNIVNDDNECATLLCKVVDRWALYMIIGVTCIISSGLSILFTFFEIKLTNTLSLLAYVVPPGICCMLMFFTCIFSLNLMINLPHLAKSMIATFAFCLPGCVTIFVYLLYHSFDLLKKRGWIRLD